MTVASAPPAAAGRSWRRARWVAVGVLVVVAGLVAVLATQPSASSLEAGSPLLGRAAPPLVGTTVTGRPFDLATYRGRWVVVNFFASWCTPCQNEEPDLVQWAYAHRAPGSVALVGVAYDDTAASAAAFLRTTGATWPALDDPQGADAVSYGVRGPPEDFVVAPDGLVAAHHTGPITAGQLDQLLSRVGAS